MTVGAARGQYSGVSKDAPLPMLLSMRAGAIDRGACIKDYSQYSNEVPPRAGVCVCVCVSW